MTVKTMRLSTQGKAVRGRCVSNWGYLRSRRTQKPASWPSSRCHMKSTGTTPYSLPENIQSGWARQARPSWTSASGNRSVYTAVPD